MLPRDRRRSLANEWHHFILSNYADVVSKQAAGTVIHDGFLNYRHCSVPLTEFFVIDATTTVIIDEAHEISNEYYAEAASIVSGIVAQAEYAWALTATPITTDSKQLANS